MRHGASPLVLNGKLGFLGKGDLLMETVLACGEHVDIPLCGNRGPPCTPSKPFRVKRILVRRRAFCKHSGYVLSLCPKGFEKGAGENFFLKVFPCRIPLNSKNNRRTITVRLLFLVFKYVGVLPRKDDCRESIPREQNAHRQIQPYCTRH